jgi:chromosome condensin MukBEF complex kleisin-like MukF subunit
VDDSTAEKGDEASSSQALSEENQAKLREILSLLQKDIQDQVSYVDLLEEVLESIIQELPDDIKASLEPISQLDNHFAAVRCALKNQSSLCKLLDFYFLVVIFSNSHLVLFNIFQGPKKNHMQIL